MSPVTLAALTIMGIVLWLSGGIAFISYYEDRPGCNGLIGGFIYVMASLVVVALLGMF